MDRLTRTINALEQYNNSNFKNYEEDDIEIDGATSSERFSPPTSTTLSPEPPTSKHDKDSLRNFVRENSLTSVDTILIKSDKYLRNNINFCDSASYAETIDDCMEGIEEAEESTNPPSTSKMPPSSSSSLLLSELSAAAAAAAASVSTNGLSNSGLNLINDKEERPSLSYKDLIIEAIESSPEKRLKLSEIYQVIRCLHPYYSRRADQWGWQNSIRHNLSLHDCFIKLPLKQTSASGVVGHFWTVIRESDDKQGSPTRRRSRANNGSGKITKSGNIKQVNGNNTNTLNNFINNGINTSCYASSIASSSDVSSLLSTTSSALTAVTAGIANGITKIKDRQSVSSDSGVMSDESQSSSPTTSTTSILHNGIINGIINGSIGNNSLLLNNGNLRKNSPSIFACPTTTSINGIKNDGSINNITTPNSFINNVSNQQKNSLAVLHAASQNQLASIASSSSSTPSAPSSTLSVTGLTNDLNTEIANAAKFTALLQQTTGQLPAQSSLMQLFDTTSKSRIIADLLQQNNNGTGNNLLSNDSLNNLLKPSMMIEAITNPATNINSPLAASTPTIPLMNRLTALNTLLNNSNGNNHAHQLSNNNSGALDLMLNDLLSSVGSNSPLATATSANSNIANELQRLQFVQFCMFQQSLFQQLVADNSAHNVNAPTSGLLSNLNGITNQTEQLASMIAQSQNHQHDSNNSTNSLLSQLLLTKLSNSNPQVAVANALSVQNTVAALGLANAAVAAADKLNSPNSLQHNQISSVNSLPTQQQLLEVLFQGQRQFQNATPGVTTQQDNNLLKIASIKNETNFDIKKEIVELPKSVDLASINNITAVKNELTSNIKTDPSIPISLQQKKAMALLIEQYMLRNEIPAAATTPTTNFGESIVSTTTKAALTNLGLSPNSTTPSPKPISSAPSKNGNNNINLNSASILNTQKEQQQNQKQLAI